LEKCSKRESLSKGYFLADKKRGYSVENEKRPASVNWSDLVQAQDDEENSYSASGARNGKIILTFLNNHTEVRGDFYPPSKGGKAITPEYITAVLERRHIRYGIQDDEINRAYEECINTNEVVRDVLMAQGDQPVDEIPSYLQLNPVLRGEKETEPLSDSDMVDHRSRSPFRIIKKDMALAKQKRLKPGIEGRNVHGDSIPFNVAEVEGVLAGGENTRMEDRYLYSNINGQLVVHKRVVSVRDTLVIEGPVGYGTGNIIFPGNVEIYGEVSDGFKIYSGGNVMIKQTFDVTDAVTKGDLTVAGGIIGRNRAMVKVGGNLTTKFIENCSAASRKTINVDLEILNSKIFTLEKVIMKDRGYIVGAEVYALQGIYAGAIGKRTAKASRIYCGVDFTLDQEREKNNASLRILSGKLDHLTKLMTNPDIDDEKRAKMEALRQRFEGEKRKIQVKISEILSKLNAYEDAVVEVKGEIFSGTHIEICQIALVVHKPLKKVRIRLDRGNNRLITEKL